jgi:hypothetical protein
MLSIPHIGTERRLQLSFLPWKVRHVRRTAYKEQWRIITKSMHVQRRYAKYSILHYGAQYTMFRIHSARCGTPCTAFLPLVTSLCVTHQKRCTLYISSLLGTATKSHCTFICSGQYAMYSTKQFVTNNISLGEECTAFLPKWDSTCHMQY